MGWVHGRVEGPPSHPGLRGFPPLSQALPGGAQPLEFQTQILEGQWGRTAQKKHRMKFPVVTTQQVLGTRPARGPPAWSGSWGLIAVLLVRGGVSPHCQHLWCPERFLLGGGGGLTMESIQINAEETWQPLGATRSQCVGLPRSMPTKAPAGVHTVGSTGVTGREGSSVWPLRV